MKPRACCARPSRSWHARISRASQAFRKHFHLALAKLECPQSLVYGWTGVAMDPVIYGLIEPNPFVIPVNPGATSTYGPGFQTQQQMKTMEQIWANKRNYFLLYGNIHCACFRLLDDLVRREYKVSNIDGLTGWNSTMLIQEILAQLEGTFGKPSAAISFQNNTVFTLPFSATDTPESLFRRIEECQEVACWGVRRTQCNKSLGIPCFCSYSREYYLTGNSKCGTHFLRPTRHGRP
jgi:hypothetical protein